MRLLAWFGGFVLALCALDWMLETPGGRRWTIDVLDNADTIAGHPHYPFCEWLASSAWWGADARDFHPPTPAR